MGIERYIPYGRENAVTRSQLRRITGLPDRTLRKAIQTARIEGIPILNDQSGRGYYISDNIDEIARQYHQNEHRAKAILVQQKHLRKRLKEVGRPV